MTPKTRLWIYRVLIAAGPLAVAYGVVSDAEVALWLGVAGAALGNGLASQHVDTDAPKHKAED